MAEILALDGEWETLFDPADSGLLEQWFRKKP
jgi:hypothetical protein